MYGNLKTCFKYITTLDFVNSYHPHSDIYEIKRKQPLLTLLLLSFGASLKHINYLVDEQQWTTNPIHLRHLEMILITRCNRNLITPTSTSTPTTSSKQMSLSHDDVKGNSGDGNGENDVMVTLNGGEFGICSNYERGTCAGRDPAQLAVGALANEDNDDHDDIDGHGDTNENNTNFAPKPSSSIKTTNKVSVPWKRWLPRCAAGSSCSQRLCYDCSMQRLRPCSGCNDCYIDSGNQPQYHFIDNKIYGLLKDGEASIDTNSNIILDALNQSCCGIVICRECIEFDGRTAPIPSSLSEFSTSSPLTTQVLTSLRGLTLSSLAPFCGGKVCGRCYHGVSEDGVSLPSECGALLCHIHAGTCCTVCAFPRCSAHYLPCKACKQAYCMTCLLTTHTDIANDNTGTAKPTAIHITQQKHVMALFEEITLRRKNYNVSPIDWMCDSCSTK
jgi:hypothetical protein